MGFEIVDVNGMGWAIHDTTYGCFLRPFYKHPQSVVHSEYLAEAILQFAMEKYGTLRMAEHKIVTSFAFRNIPDDNQLLEEAGYDTDKVIELYKEWIEKTCTFLPKYQ